MVYNLPLCYSLRTPAYRDKEIRSPVRVFIQLERPSDGCVSEPKHFQYTERDQREYTRHLRVNQHLTYTGRDGCKCNLVCVKMR